MLTWLRNYGRNFCWPILLAMAALMVIGLMALQQAERVDPGIEGVTQRQAVFAVLSLGAFIIGSAVPYRRFGQASVVLSAVTLGLLLVVFLFPGRQGSHRWIYIPPFRAVTLQPSELAKVVYIIALAWYLRYRSNYRRLVGLIVPFLITLVPMALILMEPDLGTALLLLPTLLVMLFLAGAKLSHLGVIVLLGLLAIFAPVPRAVASDTFAPVRHRFVVRALGPVRFYSVDKSLPWRQRPRTPIAYCRFSLGDGRPYDLKPLSLVVMESRSSGAYQLRRVEGWLRRDDPGVRRDTGMQQHQSIMILGAGRTWGTGADEGAGAYFRMLPADHTDFIYSVIGGRWGFFGCAAVLVLYAIIFLFGADVAASTADPFGRLLAGGVMALLVAQIFINISVTVGLMPVTGMTLPLISYGGSSLLVNCAALGLLVNVGRHRLVQLGRRPFEFDESEE